MNPLQSFLPVSFLPTRSLQKMKNVKRLKILGTLKISGKITRRMRKGLMRRNLKKH